MSNNLKFEMEKEFDKKANYNAVLHKVERMNDMKKFNIKYVVAAVAVVAVVGIVSVKSMNGTEDKVAQLNINQIENIATAKLDADMQELNVEDVLGKYDFVSDVLIPEDMKLDNVYGIYTRESFDVQNYDILHDYMLVYGENADRNVSIKFSELEKPLRDYFINGANQKTVIKDVELEVSKYQDTYMASFSKDGVFFDIETTGITEGELIKLLESMID